MARSRRQPAAGGPARYRVPAGARARAQCPQRRDHGIRGICRATGAVQGRSPLPRRIGLRRRRPPLPSGGRVEPVLRAPGPGRSPGSADECAAPSRWTADPQRPVLQRDRPPRRGRQAVRRHGARIAGARPVRAGHLCRRSGGRLSHPRGPGLRRHGGGRSAGTDRGALSGGNRRARLAPWPRASRGAADRPEGRASTAAIRSQCVHDRGRAGARLVFPPSRGGPVRQCAAPIRRPVAPGPAPRRQPAPDLGAARLPFAEPAVVAGARGNRAGRPAGFPGRPDGAAGLRRGVVAAGCPRRHPGAGRDRAARSLRQGAACGRCGFQSGAIRRALRHSGRAKGDQAARDLRPAGSARPQTAISASPAARLALPAPGAVASDAGIAQGLVRGPRSAAPGSSDPTGRRPAPRGRVRGRKTDTIHRHYGAD